MTTLLTWHHTEFGRVSACGRYRIVFGNGGWQLLDADWNELGHGPAIPALQQQAERLEKRRLAQANQKAVNA